LQFRDILVLLRNLKAYLADERFICEVSDDTKMDEDKVLQKERLLGEMIKKSGRFEVFGSFVFIRIDL